jgi:hypothetical protein
MIDLSRAILYLRLPSRAETRSKEDKSHSFPFAVANHGRLQRAGFTQLDALASLITHVHRVVILPAASDVTVLHISTPPLSASRLKTALPANLFRMRTFGLKTKIVAPAPKKMASLLLTQVQIKT